MRSQQGQTGHGIVATSLFIASILGLGPTVAGGGQRACANGAMVLVEIVSLEPYDYENDRSGNRPSASSAKDYVQNIQLQIIEVFSGPEGLEGVTLPYATPEVDFRRMREAGVEWDPDALVTPFREDRFFRAGVKLSKKDIYTAEVGDRFHLFLVRSDDFREQITNPMGFPEYSVGTLTVGIRPPRTRHQHPEEFRRHDELFRAVAELDGTVDEGRRISLLVDMVSSPNMSMATAGTYLFHRFYPEAAEDFFEGAIFNPEISTFARVSMDHLFCLTRGKEWVEGGRRHLDRQLEEKVPTDPKTQEDFMVKDLVEHWRKRVMSQGFWPLPESSGQ